MSVIRWFVIGWTGIRWSGIGWSGIEWSGIGWSGIGYSGIGWFCIEWSGYVWSGIVWTFIFWSVNALSCIYLLGGVQGHFLYFRGVPRKFSHIFGRGQDKFQKKSKNRGGHD